VRRGDPLSFETPHEKSFGARRPVKLSPTAAAGAAVHGTLSVIDSTGYAVHEPAVGLALFSDFHAFGYSYTVGS
jgi:hypothetical protein